MCFTSMRAEIEQIDSHNLNMRVEEDWKFFSGEITREEYQRLKNTSCLRAWGALAKPRITEANSIEELAKLCNLSEKTIDHENAHAEVCRKYGIKVTFEYNHSLGFASTVMQNYDEVIKDWSDEKLRQFMKEVNLAPKNPSPSDLASIGKVL